MIVRTLSSWRFGHLPQQDNDAAMKTNLHLRVSENAVRESLKLLHRINPFSLFSNAQVIACDTIPVGLTEDSRPKRQNDLLDLVRRGDTKSILLIVKNSDLRSTDEDSWTCLHWAVEMGHRDLVELFLDTDPLLLNMKTREGLSCINIAAWRGDDLMVQLLIQQGAEIDDKTKWGETPLHHAVTFGHVNVCETLLRAGANAHAEDRLRRTPYQIAMQKGTKQIRKTLSPFAPPS